MVGAVWEAQVIQVCVAEAKSGRAKQSGEGEVVGRVGQGRESVEQVADFRPVVEAFAGHGDKRNAGGLQRVLIDREGGGGAEEQRHLVPREALLLAQFAQARGEGDSSGAAARFGVGARAEAKFDEGRLCPITRLRAVGGERRERDAIGPRRVVGGAHQWLEQALHDLQQQRVRAEGQVQVERFATAARDVGLNVPEHGHVRASKAVDALFGIRHDEEVGPHALTPGPVSDRPVHKGRERERGEARQRIHNLPLTVVGVLKFVYEDGPHP